MNYLQIILLLAVVFSLSTESGLGMKKGKQIQPQRKTVEKDVVKQKRRKETQKTEEEPQRKEKEEEEEIERLPSLRGFSKEALDIASAKLKALEEPETKFGKKIKEPEERSYKEEVESSRPIPYDKIFERVMRLISEEKSNKQKVPLIKRTILGFEEDINQKQTERSQLEKEIGKYKSWVNYQKGVLEQRFPPLTKEEFVKKKSSIEEKSAKRQEIQEELRKEIYDLQERVSLFKTILSNFEKELEKEKTQVEELKKMPLGLKTEENLTEEISKRGEESKQLGQTLSPEELGKEKSKLEKEISDFESNRKACKEVSEELSRVLRPAKPTKKLNPTFKEVLAAQEEINDLRIKNAQASIDWRQERINYFDEILSGE